MPNLDAYNNPLVMSLEVRQSTYLFGATARPCQGVTVSHYYTCQGYLLAVSITTLCAGCWV